MPKNYGQGRKLSDMLRTGIKEFTTVILAICSTVAVFVDVESTGNLSMALNGGGVFQLAAMVLFVYLYKKTLMDGGYNGLISKREKVGYGITAFLFSMFMIIGKAQEAREDLKYPLLAIVLFAGYMSLFYMVVSFLGRKLTESVGHGIGQKEPGKFTRWFFEDHVFLGTFLAVVVCRLPYLIAFFPCSMTWDGGAQVASFYGYEPFTDHHPPLLSFLYGAIAMYSQEWGIPNVGMFLIPLMNTTLSFFAVAKVCELFKRMKTPYPVRWGSLVYYAAFTVWCIFDCTVIKDSLYYQMTMLFIIQIIYAIIDTEQFFGKKRNLLLLVVYAVLVTQIRNNGIYVLIAVFPFAFLAVLRVRKAAFGAMAVVSLLAVFLLDNFLYPSLGVTRIETKEDTYCIMFQQTAKYGKDYPEDVTQEEREFLDTLFDYDELVQVYNPNLADWVKNCLKICEANSADGTNSEFTDIKHQYFEVWFNQFKRHPLSYINTFLECSYGYYYPEVRPYKEGVGFYEMDRHTFTEGMHDARQIEGLSGMRFALEQISKLEFVPGIGVLYKCGFYTWCVVFAVIYLCIHRRYKALIATLPAVINIMVCLISPVNTCIRYAMPTMCMIPLILGVIFYQGEDLKKESYEM